MNAANITLGVSNIFVGLLTILISIPLVLGKVPMNSLYGVRFKKSFESEELWYKINAYGGRLLIIWSIPLVFLGVITFFLPLGGRQIWTTLIACAPLIVVIPAVMSYIYSKSL